MKPSFLTQGPNIGRGKHQRGFALVILLGILVLLVVLVVGFLISASTERASSSAFDASVAARHFGDVGVSLVQGQINIATTQGAEVAWTSQPGMIRTFGTSGTLLNAYKLYSAPEMISESVPLTNGISPDAPPADWATSSAHWTDLNAPVELNGRKTFPILDPPTNTFAGFSIDNAPGSTTYQSAPMPVRWLYILKDGRLVVPTGTGTTATITGDLADNPIVGRVAFWTDDETCKVNINTASSGTFWDVPHADGTAEKDLANYQPAQREFQRYPGHPAMTSLKEALPGSTLTADDIYKITPRIVGGGSNQGTQIASGSISPENPPDRLYANVSELIFDPSRSRYPGLDRNTVEKAKFFITANSRAPEVNLFNLPRIACWPVFKDLAPNRVTAFDKLIAFCSTVDGQPYYFQREDSFSATNDINIARNVALYEYLQYLTRSSIPGFGGNFLAKYNLDRDQILTEIFDYIRSTNLFDDNLDPGNLASTKPFTPGRVFKQVQNQTYGVHVPMRGHGAVVPTVRQSNETTGFGRAFTLSEFGVGFICNAAPDDPSTGSFDESLGSNDATKNRALAGTPLPVGQKSIQAIIIMEFFSAMHGFTVMRPDLRVQIEGLGNMTIQDNDGNLHQIFPNLDSEVLVCNSSPDNISANRSLGGRTDWRYQFAMKGAKGKDTPDSEHAAGHPKGAPTRGSVPGDAVLRGGEPRTQEDIFPFIGIPVKIPAPIAGGTMTMNATNLTVKIFAGNRAGAQGDLLQTINITLPQATLPVPNLFDKVLKFGASDIPVETWWNFPIVQPSTTTYSYLGTPSGRLRYVLENPGGNASSPAQFFYDGYDVVRTVLPKHGDYRLVAGQSNVPNTVFVPHRYYNSTNIMLASNLGGGTDSTSGLRYFDSGGKYIASANYSSSITPDIHAEASASERPEQTGDYDTGVGRHSDGPYINKPDEGDSLRSGSWIPYLSDRTDLQAPGGPTFFSPNRQIPSPGMFGSLPTGIKSGIPWQTLLFRPNSSHPGSMAPKDHLILDLFWMPVVEPYAISDRFSTAGKINMNYQILPFTYITRSSGLRALLASEKVTVIPTNQGNAYKTSGGDYRKTIDAEATLAQFRTKFQQGDVFKSASEICDLWIVPQGGSASQSYWDNNKLTGDNLRERVYTTLYPRLTTKSNTYTVYFRAQALKKVPGSTVGSWTEGKDVILGEYRGSTTLERFINPDAKIPDYAANPNNIPSEETLDSFYKWRVIENKQFAP